MRHYRVEIARITQPELAELARVDISNISRYERGEALPNLPTLIRVAHALGVDAGAFIQGLGPEDLPGRPQPYRAVDFVAERERQAAERERLRREARESPGAD